MKQSSIRRADERGGLKLRELYRRHGYLPYRMSKFEPYDLYVRNKSFLVSENILTFTDTDGRLMALKPDVTLSIVKNAQPPAGGLEKVYYHENVYRTTSAGLGFREIMQTGLECIGELDLTAMGEVLALAAESLRMLGEGGYLLDLGHTGLVSGLLEQVREEDVKKELLRELGRKNTAALDRLCAQAGLERDLADRLGRLARLYGPPVQALPQLESLAEGGRAGEALAELKGLCRIMERLGLLEGLRLDFSIANDMRYYNGIISGAICRDWAAASWREAGMTICSGAWERPVRPSALRYIWINWSGWRRTASTTWTPCCSTVRRTIPPQWRPGPPRWPEKAAACVQSGRSPRDCAGGIWCDFLKEAGHDELDQRSLTKGPAGGEGLRPVQSRRVSLPLH